MIAGYKKNKKCWYIHLPLFLSILAFIFVLIFIPAAIYAQTDERASVYLPQPTIEPPLILQNIEPAFDPPEAAAAIIPPSLQAFNSAMLEPPYPEWGGSPPLGPWVPELSPPPVLSEALPDAVDIHLEPLPENVPLAEEERPSAAPVAPEGQTNASPSADSQIAEIEVVRRPVVPAVRPESAVPPVAEPRPDLPASPPSTPSSLDIVPETAVVPENEGQDAGALVASSGVNPEAVQESAEKTPFSRIVRINEGQIVEIPYRGSGWVYLGEMGGRRGLSYDSRKIDNDGLSFVFRADTEGTYDLKFYRQDYIRGYIINDYVKVIVNGPPLVADTGWFNPPPNLDRVIANPRWPSAEQEADAFARSQVAQAETVSPVLPLSSPADPAGDGTQIAALSPPSTGQAPAQSGSSQAQPSAVQQPASQSTTRPQGQAPAPSGSPQAQPAQPSAVQQPVGQSTTRPQGQAPAPSGSPQAQPAQPSAVQQPASQSTTRPQGQAPAPSGSPQAQPTRPPATQVSPGDPADAWRNPAVPAQTPNAGRLPPVQPGIADDGIIAVKPPTVMPAAGAGAASRVTIPQDAGINEYISRARTEYDARRIDSALAILDQFRGRFPAGTDEAWWLYGQALEANSPSRDIRTAIDYYRRLIREFPQSPRYADAQRRISYLERFYFNIQ